MLIGIVYVALYFPMIFPWSKGFFRFWSPGDIQLLQVRLVYIFQLLVLNDKHVLCPGSGSSGVLRAEVFRRMTVDFCLSIWYHPANKNKEQHPNSIRHIRHKFHIIVWQVHIFLSFGGRFFFSLCVFGVFWNISTTVFAAGPLARERVWTSRCGSKSRLGLGFLGFMVRVFSWMIMIINRHPPGGFIYMII